MDEFADVVGNADGKNEPVAAANSPKSSSTPPDPFSPEQLRLSQDFSQTVGVKKALLTIPVHKPDKESWVRVHPDPAYRIETAVIELKEDREIYLVSRDLWPQLATEATFGARAFFTAITRQDVLFLWPARLPGQDGRLDDWGRSALEAATIAQRRWIRITANMHLRAYDVFEAPGDIPDPEWPEQPLGELLRIAFKDKFISGLDHPVLKRLRGEG